MISRSKSIISMISSLLFITLVLSACQHKTIPTESVLTIEPTMTTNQSISTSELPTEQKETTQPQFGLFTEGHANYYAPFEIRYDVGEWVPDDELTPTSLHSTTLAECSFRFLYGRAASWLEGPFPLEVGQNQFDYLIERFPKQWEKGTSSVHYYFHHTPDPIKHPEQVWSFEMVSSLSEESSCFESIQPLLHSLVLPGITDSEDGAIFMEEQRITTFCSNNIAGKITIYDLNNPRMLFSYNDQPGQIYMLETLDNSPQKVVDSFFPDGEIRQAILVDKSVLYLDVDQGTNGQNWKVAYLESRKSAPEILMDSECSNVALEDLVLTYDYLGYAQTNPDGVTYRITLKPIEAFYFDNIKPIVIEESDRSIGSLLVSNRFILVDLKLDKNENGILPPNKTNLGFEVREDEPLEYPIPSGQLLAFRYPVLFLERPVEGRSTEIVAFNLETSEVEIIEEEKSDFAHDYSSNGKLLSWYTPVCANCKGQQFQLLDIQSGKISTVSGLSNSESISYAKLWNETLSFVLTTERDSASSINFICEIPLRVFGNLNGPLQTYVSPMETYSLDQGLTLEGYALEGFSPYTWDLSNKTILFDEKNIMTKLPGDYGEVTSVVRFRPVAQEHGHWLYKSDNLYADQVTTGKGEMVQVYKDGEMIYEAPYDWSGWLDNLIDLNGSVYLELYRQRIPLVWPSTSGEIYQDGVSLNEKYGYKEAFGMSVLSGQISFFFKRDGQLGFRWGDTEYSLPFEDVDILRLCILDRPYSFTRGKAFYARRGYQWYYVVISNSGTN